ncbi:hypothetical protein [Streptosporangium sp. NPDC002721]|uniref:hypothetical protein n=1 Tax=Streptosporangium sp. NPDC002721 TaxID=3366188 RepID=UPI0036AF0A3E
MPDLLQAGTDQPSDAAVAPDPAAVRLAAVTEGFSVQVYRDFADVDGMSAPDTGISAVSVEVNFVRGFRETIISISGSDL